MKPTLHPSADGKFLVDSNGNRWFKFDDELKAFISITHQGAVHATGSMPGHWECYDDCVHWDKDGNCIRTIRRCDWVFPEPNF